VTTRPAAPAIELSIEEAWQTCRDLYEGLSDRSTPAAPSLQDELLFCLLGGYGVSYELNRSATEVVAVLEPFSRKHDEHELRSVLENVLRKPSFEPRRRDGTLRRYRFPTRKASLIVAARRWLHDQSFLDHLLRSLPTGRERRNYLCQCPGVGLKTASWLLRNLGLAHDLAILDVHLVRALSQSGRLAFDARLPKDYEAVEEAFLGWCVDLDADPGAFDLFVWEWQRGAFAT
jgi:N-glycosylase/DNA lyase